jgi:hypothetical protein
MRLRRILITRAELLAVSFCSRLAISPYRFFFKSDTVSVPP